MPKLPEYHLNLTKYDRLSDFIKANILNKQALTSLFNQTTSELGPFLNKDQKKVRTLGNNALNDIKNILIKIPDITHEAFNVLKNLNNELRDYYNNSDPVVNIVRSKYFFIDAKIDKLTYLNYPFMRVLVLDKYPLNYLKFYIAEFFKSLNVKKMFNVLYNIDKDKVDGISINAIKAVILTQKL
ncbi:42941_t:CDS:1 [Gigaspora margarita]|uniref:42941_t:CDS:1 n=1 Tax=Gigaspora margarita TaxID=4874 RepID=A0ABM8VX24_GIGMA|nr:42941_t:CDS:1 [Gigaspora margarita]